jgi:hypothetical protein
MIITSYHIIPDKSYYMAIIAFDLCNRLYDDEKGGMK